MQFGFEIVGAKPKAQVVDPPKQEPMRGSNGGDKIRRAPSTDQKRVRRQLARTAAVVEPRNPLELIARTALRTGRATWHSEDHQVQAVFERQGDQLVVDIVHPEGFESRHFAQAFEAAQWAGQFDIPFLDSPLPDLEVVSRGRAAVLRGRTAAIAAVEHEASREGLMRAGQIVAQHWGGAGSTVSEPTRGSLRLIDGARPGTYVTVTSRYGEVYMIKDISGRDDINNIINHRPDPANPGKYTWDQVKYPAGTYQVATQYEVLFHLSDLGNGQWQKDRAYGGEIITLAKTAASNDYVCGNCGYRDEGEANWLAEGGTAIVCPRCGSENVSTADAVDRPKREPRYPEVGAYTGYGWGGQTASKTAKMVEGDDPLVWTEGTNTLFDGSQRPRWEASLYLPVYRSDGYVLSFSIEPFQTDASARPAASAPIEGYSLWISKGREYANSGQIINNGNRVYPSLDAARAAAEAFRHSDTMALVGSKTAGRYSAENVRTYGLIAVLTEMLRIAQEARGSTAAMNARPGSNGIYDATYADAYAKMVENLVGAMDRATAHGDSDVRNAVLDFGIQRLIAIDNVEGDGDYTWATKACRRIVDPLLIDQPSWFLQYNPRTGAKTAAWVGSWISIPDPFNGTLDVVKAWSAEVLGFLPGRAEYYEHASGEWSWSVYTGSVLFDGGEASTMDEAARAAESAARQLTLYNQASKTALHPDDEALPGDVNPGHDDYNGENWPDYTIDDDDEDIANGEFERPSRGASKTAAEANPPVDIDPDQYLPCHQCGLPHNPFQNCPRTAKSPLDGQRGHTLLTAADRKKLPALYSQDDKGDAAVAYVKFFSPYSNWYWYATEFDGDDTFFGWVVGFESELGYFSLNELESSNRNGLPLVERDMYWSPATLGQIKSDKNKYGSKIAGVDRPGNGDVVVVGNEGRYYAGKPGQRAVVELGLYGPGTMAICFGASAFRPPDGSYVSCSGGPLPEVFMKDLKYVGKTQQRFWYWNKYGPGAGNGEDYTAEVDLWEWTPPANA
jgi:DNA-directed RNA polymerase subunit RPC12/RpoP